MTRVSDPLPAYNFYVSLIDSPSTAISNAMAVMTKVLAGGFTECSGLEGTLEIEEYSEGGQNEYVHKFPTRMTYSNIVLKRGISLSEDLWNWYYAYVIGQGKRRDGIIVLANELQVPIKMWKFKGGLPLKWTGPTLNASQSEVAIESIEIAHQGLETISAGALAGEALDKVSSLL
jgi:phage tail-like protein